MAKKTTTVKSAKKVAPSLEEDIKKAKKESPVKKAKNVGPSRVQAKPESSDAESSESAKKITTKYTVSIDKTEILSKGSKIQMAHALISAALNNGMSMSELNESKFVATFPLLREYPISATVEEIRSDLDKHAKRYATKEDKHIVMSKTRMVICNQWYPTNADKMIDVLCAKYPNISVKKS